MPEDDTGDKPLERTADSRWEVARPHGTSLSGVRMAGFRDRTAGGLDMRVLPQPAVIVVIGLGTAPITVEGASGHRPLSGLVAAMSPGPARIRGKGVECVEVALSPRAAYALLGVSPLELDGSITAFEDLWGRHARLLHEQLADTASWQERLALTDGFLRRRAAKAPPMAAEVAATWDAIVAGRGRVRIGDLAASCGWSRKRLWARFSSQVGLTPKRAAMLVRFDHAARALLAGEPAGDVAAACGYADQPHLHRDVQALAGCTPGALAGLTASTGP
ncbi:MULTISPECIES: helix-turn-helix domain-containing protein [Streptomyces]|uniref:AraC family transcriptional regulator n=1 Tax=Streptomyces virginiae TaxID=1961 RepID=A0ABQ3NYS2_STRVG|nr:MULTISPECIES: helix-turn-helix transcriptional regulator [Streptomyces]KOU90650.1 AraC family transcriptional regulator [Streptomyces sp. XY533]KOV16653.1 AraC family transcriptional regulator [Streptomyces sp. XY511]MBP2343533.1 AraC-like DNA-binding protein [Streptomyces virginiae]RSS98803.1 AraC family transcriptional regulator [Streptomyces sp. WAC05950]GGQ37999.1 AraC family transcriptional regulator [Streptomyces virginiae]